MNAPRYLTVASLLLTLAIRPAGAADPQLPDYLLKARATLAEASNRSGGVAEAADELSFARNYLLRAEKEFEENLSWGKLKEKAEPTVRYYSSLAQLQSAIVLARAGKIDQDKERARLEELAAGVKARIRVFDDKMAAIAALKADLAKRDATIAELTRQTAARQADIDRLAGERKKDAERQSAQVATLQGEVSAKAAALTAALAKGDERGREAASRQQQVSALEQKNAELQKNLDASRADNQKLRGELAALAAQKGAVESQSREQIEALSRQQAFVAEIGKLGGVIKSGSDNMTVIFGRSVVIKTPRNDTLSAEGDKVIGRIVELLKHYPEYRVKLKVHGFGQPAKSEDAAATDRMARLIREALLEKGKLEPTAVEALGAGAADPIYPKNNPEGNKRVEVTFIKK